MKPVTPSFRYQGSAPVTYTSPEKDIAELPALYFEADRLVMIEWQPSEEERTALLRGENVRVWIRGPIHPIAVTVTDPASP